MRKGLSIAIMTALIGSCAQSAAISPQCEVGGKTETLKKSSSDVSSFFSFNYRSFHAISENKILLKGIAPDVLVSSYQTDDPFSKALSPLWSVKSTSDHMEITLNEMDASTLSRQYETIEIVQGNDRYMLGVASGCPLAEENFLRSIIPGNLKEVEIAFSQGQRSETITIDSDQEINALIEASSVYAVDITSYRSTAIAPGESRYQFTLVGDSTASFSLYGNHCLALGNKLYRMNLSDPLLAYAKAHLAA